MTGRRDPDHNRDEDHDRDEDRGADRGAISLFVAISAVSLLMLAGLVIDGGGRLRAMERADAYAQEAARAGGQEVDQAQLLQGKGFALDPAKAKAGAEAYLGGQNVGGVATATATTVTVTVTIPYHTALLGLIGIDTITVTGVGVARIVPGIDAPIVTTG
ncbi:pilus assembly protein TadG-related protein [Streptacidiphilus sp. EB129]|uniref:pilus assembly protein TadG-related protein n=1 Tax=Streptacidiphilus sp. EB129 TaxID=3156262 RepID=UPI0035197EB1